MCLITIGFLRAHFTIYQPQSHNRDEFCEDIPGVGESVFVMEYQHDYLRKMPVDFRIIRNETDVGFYAQWPDVEKLDSLDKYTVFYAEPAINAEGVYTINYSFQNKGMFIGIVTAKRPDDGTIYRAVFPFEVGGRSLGYLPLFVILLILAQAGYWWINRRLAINRLASLEQ